MNHPFYQVGGTLSPDADSYVKRQADADILEGVRSDKLCYVFNSRQIGKSSLIARLSKILKKEEYLIVLVDLSSIGSTQVEVDEWYASIANEIASQLESIPSLQIEFGRNADFETWWNSQNSLTSLSRFGRFIERIVLRQINQKILISFDEIDSVLSLNFPTDDFFGFIRACYNKRSSNSSYRLLNFMLLGVATPSDLIADETRTPFNLGQKIELYGFTFDEAKVLAKGFEGKVNGVDKILQEILDYTGGQPFLTHKICAAIAEMEDITVTRNEANIVQKLVESRIVQNWEDNDDPPHLRTIQNRIVRSRKHPIYLLNLYRNIWQNGSIPIDNSPEQSELQLTGLVKCTDHRLEIYNPIYKAVFNEDWIKITLEAIRPYADQMRAWFRSNCTDPSRLLRGQALQEAIEWAEISSDYLTNEDRQFLEASQQRYKEILDACYRASSAAPERVAVILEKIEPEIVDIAANPAAVIRVINSWAGEQPELAEILYHWLLEIGKVEAGEGDRIIPEGQEETVIQNLVKSHFESGEEAKKHFEDLKSEIRKDYSSDEIVRLYQVIREQPGCIREDSYALRSLITLGLVESRNGQLYVANQFYSYVFDKAWIEQMLNRHLIDDYEVVENLRPDQRNDLPLYVYRVKATFRRGDQNYILQQIRWTDKNDVAKQSVARRIFKKKIETLEKLKVARSLPELFSSRPLYIVYKEVIGRNLDQEIDLEKGWNNDQVISLLIEVSNILLCAHEQGLTHLNLKPSNIRRCEDGLLALIDFSILKEVYAATVTQENVNPIQLIGTQGHIPPELLRDGAWELIDESEDRVDSYAVSQVRQQWDIYSLGVTGIQMLTNIEPYKLNRDSRTGQFLWRFLRTGSSKSSIGEGLARILDKMTHPEPEKRYRFIGDVLQDLEKLKTQRAHMKRLAWADPRKKSLRFWAITGIATACAFIGSIHWSSFEASKREKLEGLQETHDECISTIESSIPGKTDLIDTKVIAKTVQVGGACDRYLQQISDLDEFSPMPTDSDVTDKINRDLQSTKDEGFHGLLALIARGEASIVLQDVLGGESSTAQKLQESELETAGGYFERAIDAYPNDPLGHFYLGVVENIQTSADGADDFSLRNFYLDALKGYLTLPSGENLRLLKAGEQKSAIEESTTLSLIRTEVDDEDFPALTVLGYLWSQDPRLEDLKQKSADLKDLRDFDVIQKIYELAQRANPEAKSLIYNQAIANAIGGNNTQTAIDLFEGILIDSNIPEDSQLRKFSKAGLILIEASQGDLSNADDLRASDLAEGEAAEKFLENLQACAAELPNCDRQKLDWEKLPNKGREIFRYVPMFSCQSNIPLALAYPELCFDALK